MPSILQAFLAFLGASFAQLVNYKLSERREDRTRRRLQEQQYERTISQIDYMVMLLSLLLSYIRFEEESDLGTFSGDPISFLFRVEIKYMTENEMVHPGISNRLLIWSSQCNAMLDQLERKKEPTKFTVTGVAKIAALANQGIKLACGLEKGKKLVNYQYAYGDITPEEMAERFDSYSFVGAKDTDVARARSKILGVGESVT